MIFHPAWKAEKKDNSPPPPLKLHEQRNFHSELSVKILIKI